MATVRLRVRPPHAHRGLLILIAVFVAVCGAVADLPLLLMFMLVDFGKASPWLLTVVIFIRTVLLLIPPAFVGLYMARCCQHPKYVYWAGQLAGTIYFLTTLVCQQLRQGGISMTIEWWEYPLALLIMLLVGVATGLFSLAVMYFYKHFVSRLADQDGTLCANCGYCVAHSDSALCPECGTSRDIPLKPFGRIYRLAQWLDHRRRHLLTMVCAIVLGATWLFVWHESAYWRFTRRFPSDVRVLGAGHRPANSQPAQSWFYRDAVEVGRALADDPHGRYLVIQYFRAGYFDPPKIQLRLATEVQIPQSEYVTYSDGQPRVLCELNLEQSRQVMRHGVPSELINALRAAADAAGWQAHSVPAPPIPQPDVVVDPDPIFDELPSSP